MGGVRKQVDRRVEQAAAMAHADRLSLFHLVVTAPLGQLSAAELAGRFGDPGTILTHLLEMERVGVVSRLPGNLVDTPFRPTADGLARFGGAAIGLADPARAGGSRRLEHGRLIERIIDDLSAQFDGIFERATVSRFVDESYRLLAERASVTTFLPALAARFAAERLGALAQADSTQSLARSLLFVCVRNQGRSQIAAALARARVGRSVVIRTAGSAPASGLDAVVVAELNRRGVGGLVDFPRPLSEEVVKASGVIVTMGCGDACPVIPGRRYLDWRIEDPVGRTPAEVAEIVDDVESHVNQLIDSLGAQPEESSR